MQSEGKTRRITFPLGLFEILMVIMSRLFVPLMAAIKYLRDQHKWQSSRRCHVIRGRYASESSTSACEFLSILVLLLVSLLGPFSIPKAIRIEWWNQNSSFWKVSLPQIMLSKGLTHKQNQDPISVENLGCSGSMGHSYFRLGAWQSSSKDPKVVQLEFTSPLWDEMNFTTNRHDLMIKVICRSFHQVKTGSANGMQTGFGPSICLDTMFLSGNDDSWEGTTQKDQAT